MRKHLPTLALLVVATVVLVLGGEVVDRFIEFGNSDNPLRNRMIFTAVWLLSLVAALGLVVIRSKWIRVLLAAPLAVSSFAELSYYFVTGSRLQYGEMFSMWIARDDAQSALLSYWGALAPAVLLSLALWAGLVALPVLNAGRLRTMVASTLYLLLYPLPFVLIGVAIALKGGSAALGMPPMVKHVAMFGSIVHSQWAEDFDDARQSLDDVTVDRSIPRPHVVLIVDESVRGDFLSINRKEMGTTLFLESQQPLVANFGVSASAFDCSHYSNAAMRYGVNANHVKDSLLQYPSIWNYAHQAGYVTHYIDAQRRHGQLQNFMSHRERELIDHFIQYNNVEPVERGADFIRKDLRAAQDLRAILQKKEPQFVYINKEGAHTPYEGKYPADQSLFLPHMELREPIREGMDRTRLVNSYRNAIAWSVDKFFSDLLSGTDLSNSVIFYTSDHGQNLLDKGIPTHCAQPSPPVGVASVPLFAISEHSTWGPRLRKAAEMNYEKASQFNLFGTLLITMGYEPDRLKFKYDPSLLEPLPKERFFYTGDALKGEIRKHPFVIDAAKDGQ